VELYHQLSALSVHFYGAHAFITSASPLTRSKSYFLKEEKKKSSEEKLKFKKNVRNMKLGVLFSLASANSTVSRLIFT
jgi:hypothetical protein